MTKSEVAVSVWLSQRQKFSEAVLRVNQLSLQQVLHFHNDRLERNKCASNCANSDALSGVPLCFTPLNASDYAKC